MPIVASALTRVAPQADGRRWVHETHTDQYGEIYARAWLALAADDLNAALAAYATQLSADLVTGELGENLGRMQTDGSTASVITRHCTLAQLRTALRQAYQTATRQEAIMLGDFLSGLTDGQLQALFGMTALQVTTLRVNKLTPAANTAASVRAGQGQ